MTNPLTLEERRNLAMNVLSEVATLFEFFEEKMDSSPWPVPIEKQEEAAQVVSNWLAQLPTGGKWLTSLPDPTVKVG